MSVYHEEEYQRLKTQTRLVRVVLVRTQLVHESTEVIIEVENALSEEEACKVARDKALCLSPEYWEEDDKELWCRAAVDESVILHPRQCLNADVDALVQARRGLPERLPVEGNLELPFTKGVKR